MKLANGTGNVTRSSTLELVKYVTFNILTQGGFFGVHVRRVNVTPFLGMYPFLYLVNKGKDRQKRQSGNENNQDLEMISFNVHKQ